MPIARKRFGQHFLHDTHVVQQLIDAINPCPDQFIVEIGPGLGALTFPMLKKIRLLHAIELDKDLIPILENHSKQYGTLILHQADALEFDFSELNKTSQAIRVIGNLPYNISTPLIFYLLTFSKQIQDMHFMLQKEVVDRMAAAPGNSAYGRLSVMVQYHCAVSSLFNVPPSAFQPPPKVDSSVVRLQPYQTLPHVAKNYEHFKNLVREAFNHRRKTLRNSLKEIIAPALWKNINIDSGLRPEQLSVEAYVKLSNASE